MRIFGKHIFRSIKADPRQPLMIVLIVSLCVAVMILSVALPVNIYRNERESLLADEWTADIEVSLKGNAEHRLIYDREIADAVNGRGRVIGEFALTGFLSRGDGGERIQVSIGAFDLMDASDFYHLQCVSGGNLTNTNLRNTSIISEKFADEHSLSLGDTVRLNVLGEEFTYVVRAIVRDTGIMKRENMLVDISSIRAALAERSPIIASLGSAFNPYTKVHVKLHDGVDPSAVKAELEGLPSFEDKKVDLSTETSKQDYMATLFTVVVLIPSVLLLIVAVMMTVSTFDLLQKRRGDDIALFKIVGADAGHLNMLLYLESALYGLIGGILGSLLSIPLMRAINKLYGFRYSFLRFGIKEALIGLGSSFVFVALCTLLYIFKQRKKSLTDGLKGGNLDTDSRLLPKILLFGAPVAVLLAVTAILPIRLKFVGAFLLMFAIVTFLYVISPHIISIFASAISHVLSRMKRGAGDFVLAAKSCKSSYPLRHAGRITTVLVSVFITISVVLSALEGQLNSYVDFATFEYVGVMADEGTKARVCEIDGVLAIAEANIASDVIFAGGKTSTGIAASGDIDECFEDYMLPNTMPKGNSVALSNGLVRMLGIEIGDTVKCEIGDIPCELILTEIVDARGDFVFYDADYIGSGHQMLCIRTDGRAETYESLRALFDERGIECITKDEFFSTIQHRVTPQSVMMRSMLYAMMLLALVGVFNVLAEQRMARRREFDILVQNGKTKLGIFSLQLTEIIYLLVFTLIIAIPFSQILCFVVDISGISFGITLYS